MIRKYYHIEINLHLDKLKAIGIDYDDNDVSNNFPPDKLFELFIMFINNDKENATKELYSTGVYSISKSIPTSPSTVDKVTKNYTWTHLEKGILDSLNRNKFLIDAGMLSYTTTEEKLYECSIILDNFDSSTSKLELIKFVKDVSGHGLKESKDIVDDALKSLTPMKVLFNLTEGEIETFDDAVKNRGISSQSFYFDGVKVLREKKLEMIFND